MAYPFKHSICSEVFDKWPLAEACRAVRKAGYTGYEIAPFTLSDDPAAIPAAQRREYASIMQAEGLTFAGLHWLMVSPKGMHVTTPEPALRERSWDYVRRLVDLCADLGPGGIMVFGSPYQRGTTGGLSREEATKHYVDGLAGAAPHALERGVTILVEALPVQQCDVVTSLEEAAAIVHQINVASIRTMFDVHNAINETEPHAVLVDRYFDLIRHVHLNELDGKHPGAGDYDFFPLVEALARRGYTGWLSAEVFDFSPGAEKIAQDSLRHMESAIARLGA